MFRIKNYSSFHGEMILDMRASALREHPSHIIECDDMKILKTMSIYGANASGKSNLIDSMFIFEKFIVGQFFSQKEDNEYQESKISIDKEIQPFALLKDNSKSIEMEMIFICNGKRFQFGFELSVDKISSEWLLVDSEVVFERKFLKVVPGKKYKSMLKDYTKKVFDDRLFIAALDYFSEGEVRSIVDNFRAYFEKHYNVFFEFYIESTVKSIGLSTGMNKKLADNEILRNKVASHLQAIDTGISGLAVRYITTKNKITGKEVESPIIETIHQIYDEKGELSGTVNFDLNQESSGTLRFLSYIQGALVALDSGGVFIVDELTARFHPLLTRFVVSLFQSKENKNAQLIFTTHDTSILNKEQFRRDEVAFVDKNAKGESSLYTLSDLNVRSDATFNKDYFSGKYGAIPIINDILKLDGEVDG